MIQEARNVPAGTTLSADLCIVGTGAAGITIASRFRDTRTSVILLEAGGERLTRESRTFYEGTVSGDVRASFLTEFRLRQLGGTTNHWGGHCYPLEPIDFEKRSWVPHSGWPITREDLDPYFVHAAKLLGLDGVPGPELPTVDSPALGFLDKRFEPRVFRIAPVRFARRFRSLLSQAENLSTFMEAPVFRFHMNETKTRIKHVSAGRSPDERFNVKADHYVLAAGGVENPRLLLLNGIGRQYDVVGRYFVSHPALVNQVVHLRDTYRPAVEYCQQFGDTQGLVKLALRAEDQRRFQIGNVHLRLKKRGEIDPRLDPPTLLSRTMDLEGLTSVPMGLHAEHYPDPGNRVRLGDEKDPLGNPRVHIQWVRGNGSEAAVRKTVELFGQEIGGLRAGRYRMSSRDRETWAVTPAHQLGATRMHDDPARGVVDRDCRVHDVSNLYVAGGSVFTTSGAANPTFTIIALAIRLADHLRERTAAV